MKRLLTFLFLLIAVPAWAVSPIRIAVNENRLEDALNLCRQFELLATSDKDNDLACTWVYLRLDKPDAAEKNLSKLQKFSTIPEYQLLQSFSWMKKGHYDEAKRVLDTISAQHKGTPVGINADELIAELYEMKGQLDAAAFVYRQIISRKADRGRANWGLGRFYLGQGDLAKAKIHLEQTARIWPHHVSSRYNLAVVAMSQDNLTEAGSWLAAAFRLNRADPGVLEQLGVLFEKRKQISEAVKYWQKAIEVDKNSALAKEKLDLYRADLLDLLLAKGDFEKVLSELEASGKNVSADPKLLLRRAMAMKGLGLARTDRSKIDKAAADFQVYLNSNPKDVNAIRELAICYVNQNRHDEAIQYFKTAARAEPSNGMNYAWQAFSYEAKGELEKAKELWKKALSLLKDPAEVERANRRIASIEKKLAN